RAANRSAGPRLAFVIALVAVGNGLPLFSGLPSARTAGAFLAALTALLLLGLDFLAWRRTSMGAAETEARWTHGTTLRLLAVVLVGLRRMALPALACLALVYLLLLNRTLRLDAAAGSAIDMAARNDLQWVLTHGSVGSD